MKKKATISFLVLGGLIALLIMLWPFIAHWVVYVQLKHVEQRWNGKITYEVLDINGFTFSFTDLKLSGSDTTDFPLFYASKLSLTLDPWTLIRGSRIPEKFLLDSAYVYLKEKNNRWNFQSLQPDSTPLIKLIPGDFRILPQIKFLFSLWTDNPEMEIQVRNTRIEIKREFYSTSFKTFDLYAVGDSIHVAFIGTKNKIQLTGKRFEDSLFVNLVEPLQLEIPARKNSIYQMKLNTPSSLSIFKHEKHMEMIGNFSNSNFQIDPIADELITVDPLTFNSEIEFISSRKMNIKSKLSIGKLTITDSLFYDETNKKPIISSRLIIHPMTAKTFRESTPSAVIGELKELDYRGELGYQLVTHLDFHIIDSSNISGEVLKRNFSLIHPGVSFEKLQAPFSQPVYDGDIISHHVWVGPEYPAFIPLENVPDFFIKSVITSEDGSFFFHKGFNSNAFRSSLIENIKSGAFKRGASTISMQLVKNVYLHRGKQLSRKIQELFITWLLENSRMVTKERMMEIYVNVIELGPGIYGLGEASRFYFEKSPSLLTLEESLFLSLIIPSPKYFYNRFDKEGNLKTSSINLMKFVAEKMAQFKHISQEDFELLDFSEFKLTGKAKSFLNGYSPLDEDEDEDIFLED